MEQKKGNTIFRQRQFLAKRKSLSDEKGYSS